MLNIPFLSFFSTFLFLLHLFHRLTLHRSSSTHIYPPQKNIRGNVAAVEPYNHTPQKSTSMTSSNQQHQQIIQDLAMLKLKSQHQQHSPTGIMSAESDESKLARQKQHELQLQQQSQGLLMKNGSNDAQSHQTKDNVDSNNEKQTTKAMTVPHPTSSPSTTSVSSSSDNMNGKKNEPKSQTLPYKYVANNSLNVGNSSLLSHKIISSVLSATASKTNESDSEKAGETNDTATSHNGTKNSTQIVSSTPLMTINKSVAEPVQNSNSPEDRPAIKPKAIHQIPSGNLVVPPRKPISSVAPTSITLAPKTISQAPKVHMVAPNNNIQAPISSVSENDKSRPALPPKPNKNNQQQQQQVTNEGDPSMNMNDNNLPIKAKPLTIKKQPLSEQPKLRSLTSNLKTIQYSASRRIEMPPAFLFPEIATAELKDNSHINDLNGNNVNQTSIISKLVNGAINLNNNQDNGSITSTDETDKSITPSSTPVQDEKLPSVVESIVRRKRNLIGDNVKAKLARRVSFDPLALLLDASLEGELELVKKTAMQVTNPSAANDEGITALHNAICAGHLEIVK
jgi:apoptosis-stimulating of p53 protein 1